MISAFGIDHGYEQVEKLGNPLSALRGASGGVKAVVNPAGKRRAAGLASVPKPVQALRTFTGATGAGISGGLKRAGAAISGPAGGKRAASGLRQRVGGAVTGAGQKTFNQPFRTGAIGLGAAGAGTAGVAGGGAYALSRRKRPGQV